MRRNVVVLHQLALRPLLRVEQRGHQLRLQFVRRKIVAVAADLVDLPVLNADACRLRTVVRLRPGRYLNSVLRHVESAQRRLPLLIRIPGPTQLRGNLLRLDLLPSSHRLRQRVNLGRIGEYRRPEPFLDNPVVLDVKVRKHNRKRHGQNQKEHHPRAQHRVARQPADLLARLSPTPLRNSDLDGHSSRTLTGERYGRNNLSLTQTSGAAKRFVSRSYLPESPSHTSQRPQLGHAEKLQGMLLLYPSPQKRKETRSTCGSRTVNIRLTHSFSQKKFYGTSDTAQYPPVINVTGVPVAVSPPVLSTVSAPRLIAEPELS